VAQTLRELFWDKDIVVFLHGDLAAGKTTLVQHFAKDSQVSSPTFSLQHCYENDIYHYDLYNIDTEKFMQSGLVHELEKNGIHFIEWAQQDLENFIQKAGFATATIQIKSNEDSREYHIDVA